MTRIISFGSYTFDNRWTSISTNFGDAVPRTIRLPGMDGGYDQYGDDPAPTEIGRMQARLKITKTSGSAMQATRDALRALAGLGRQVLTIEPSGGTATRWTYARINSVQTPEKMPAISDVISEFAVDWQVSVPRWYSTNATSGTADATSGTATALVKNNAGNAPAIPVVTVVAGTADLAGGVTLLRWSGVEIADYVEYSGTVVAGGTLVIDCKALAVTLDGSAAYGTAFSFDHPAWLRIMPGDNELEVQMGAGEAATVTVEWDDTWF